MLRIAILEDDPDQSALLRLWLREGGHASTGFGTANAFQHAFRRESFDLLIIDWMLPESSGIEVLRWIRQTTESKVPVLFVTCRDSEQDIVYALENGADDYMVKPVTRAVTLARVTALARRSGVDEGDTGVLEAGEFRFDLDESVATRAGEPIALTEREFRLAVKLFSNIGRVLSRDHLLETVWGTVPGIATRSVDTHISRLRKKLQLLPENGWKLKAIYLHGYRLEQLSDADEGRMEAQPA